MIKLLAHPVYAWAGAVGAKVAALAGIASAARDREILNLDAEGWFLLCVVYMHFLAAALLARLVRAAEGE